MPSEGLKTYTGSSLTTGLSKDNRQSYDFGTRGAHLRARHLSSGLPEGTPFPGGPHTFEIMPTHKCDAACGFCAYEVANRIGVDDFKARRTAAQSAPNPALETPTEPGLSIGSVINLLDGLRKGKTTRGTYWAGGGEPLTWSSIVSAVRYAATFSQVFMQSNGIRLDQTFATDPTDPRDLKLINLLSLSVTGHNRDVYKASQGVNQFDRVVRNIRRVLDMKRIHELTKLKVNIKIMVDQNNYFFLPEMVEFFNSLGPDILGLRAVQDYNYGSELPRESVELTEEQRYEACEFIGAHQASSERVRRLLDNFAHSLMAQLEPSPPTLRCWNALDGHFAAVTPDGEVYIGNPEIGDKRFAIGNINTQPWSQIWRSQRHNEVSALMDEMQRDDSCASGLCRHKDANRGADRLMLGLIPPPDPRSVMRNLGAFM